MDTITKNATISTAILDRRMKGDTLPQAIDAVLGTGTYAALAGDLYDVLRTKSAK